jgi:hypothetical protein
MKEKGKNKREQRQKKRPLIELWPFWKTIPLTTFSAMPTFLCVCRDGKGEIDGWRNGKKADMGGARYFYISIKMDGRMNGRKCEGAAFFASFLPLPFCAARDIGLPIPSPPILVHCI